MWDDQDVSQAIHNIRVCSYYLQHGRSHIVNRVVNSTYTQGRSLVEIVGEVEKNLGEVQLAV